MHILFYSVWDVSPQKGGTERITSTLCTEFRRKGHKCYLAYKTDVSNEYEKSEFDGRIKISFNTPNEFITNYMLTNKIDVVHIQSDFLFVRRMCELRDTTPFSFKIIFSHHFEPGWEERSVSVFDIFLDIKKSVSFISKAYHIVRLLAFPINKLRISNIDRKCYRLSYRYADYVVLLSKYFFDQYAQYAKIVDTRKFYSIPNALSFKNFLPFSDISKKEKIVLIVSRLEETQKRISQAIKIWADLYSYTYNENWKLYIVGTGRYDEYYKTQVKKYHLDNVFFEGVQNPQEYYVKASLFMMTSESEGWGLTLTEAMQFGCVPIAFDTYASLKDIVINGYNGAVVNRNQQSKYTDAMLNLMKDYSYRELLARQGITFSKSFAIEKVVDLWLNLYKE